VSIAALSDIEQRRAAHAAVVARSLQPDGQAAVHPQPDGGAAVPPGTLPIVDTLPPAEPLHPRAVDAALHAGAAYLVGPQALVVTAARSAQRGSRCVETDPGPPVTEPPLAALVVLDTLEAAGAFFALALSLALALALAGAAFGNATASPLVADTTVRTVLSSLSAQPRLIALVVLVADLPFLRVAVEVEGAENAHRVRPAKASWAVPVVHATRAIHLVDARVRGLVTAPQRAALRRADAAAAAGQEQAGRLFASAACVADALHAPAAVRVTDLVIWAENLLAVDVLLPFPLFAPGPRCVATLGGLGATCLIRLSLRATGVLRSLVAPGDRSGQEGRGDEESG
jgi:hypothetical protein